MVNVDRYIYIYVYHTWILWVGNIQVHASETAQWVDDLRHKNSWSVETLNWRKRGKNTIYTRCINIFPQACFKPCWRRHASGLFSGRSPISYILRYFGSPQAVGHGFSPPGDYACKETCKVTYNDGSKGKVDVFRSGGDTQSPAKCILALQCEWGAECEGAGGSPAHQFLSALYFHDLALPQKRAKISRKK